MPRRPAPRESEAVDEDPGPATCGKASFRTVTERGDGLERFLLFHPVGLPRIPTAAARSKAHRGVTTSTQKGET